MFEKARELLLALQIEAIQNCCNNNDIMLLAHHVVGKSPEKNGCNNNDPMLLGTEIFCAVLRGLPAGQNAEFPYPGVFGLEFTTPEIRADWEKRFTATQGPTPSFSTLPPQFQPLANAGCRIDDGGRGHTTIDYAEVLTKGLKSFYEQVATGNTPFEKCARKALLAVKEFAAQYNAQVPWEPARNFEEALQSIWLTYECIIFSELVPYSYSWGRMDQYLLPFAADLSEDELTDKFTLFFRFLNQVNFNDDASALNVGGEEGFNKVSRAILEAAARNKMPAPMLTVRVSDALSKDDWERFLRPELLTCGQPTLYGEESCRAALRQRGLPEENISRWAANSCMGLVIPGEEWQDMWGAVIPQTLALELTLNQGCFFNKTAICDTSVTPVELTSYSILYQQLLKYIEFLFNAAVSANRERCANFMMMFQNVFVSLFYKDCIARKKEVRNGGVRHHTMIVETMGLVNLADSLITIRKLVFEEKKYTLAELTEALKTNFVNAPELLADIAKLPKFGENNGLPEAVLKQLTDDIAEIAERFKTEAFLCAPSLHTLHHHISYGRMLEATADGRRKGEPLAKNAGTSPAVQTEHTSLILAASCWDQSRFSGGQPLDLWISAKDWHEKEQVHRYAALIKTYFKRGGLQLQFNGADPAELRAAMEYPEKYGHLIVRIGGFSVRFVDIPRNEQEDFIRRFANGM